jgi:hypothetical protein
VPQSDLIVSRVSANGACEQNMLEIGGTSKPGIRRIAGRKRREQR